MDCLLDGRIVVIAGLFLGRWKSPPLGGCYLYLVFFVESVERMVCALYRQTRLYL